MERSYNIESLQLHDLNFMRTHKWNTLEVINLNRNMVNNIDILNQYPNLKVINATNCYIEEVNLKLLKLEHLDLSNNFLKSFPVLANMQKLKVLNLNSNRLIDLKNMNIDFISGLKSLDVGNNPTL